MGTRSDFKADTRADGLKLYAILGHAPLLSASPPMQEAAFAAAGIHARYLRLAETDARRALETAKVIGLSGANVTAPLKESVFRLVEPDAAAAAIGAVNTLSFLKDGRVEGRNTDPDGIAGALAELGAVQLRGLNAAVIGTGGAARAAVYALRRGGAEVTVLGRRPERAEELAESLGARAAFPLQSREARQTLLGADVVIGTADTRERIVPPEWLSPHALLLDALYGVPSALFLDASSRGLPCADGTAWLLHQGAASFAVWTGITPSTDLMRRALSKALASPPARFSRGISLIGCSGAGKSAAAPPAARLCGLQAADVDEAVVQASGRSVSEIFQASGEAEFREKETAVLRRLAEIPSVLAAGGGTCLNPQNRELLTHDRLTVWLAISPERALLRIPPGTRPLLSATGTEALFRQTSELMSARREGCALAADVVLDASRPLPEVASAIARLWHSLPMRDDAAKGADDIRRAAPLFSGETEIAVLLPPSKSQLIRCLLAAALADSPSRLRLPRPVTKLPQDFPQDVNDALHAVQTMGALVHHESISSELAIVPAPCRNAELPARTAISCGESALLCRLLLAAASALGREWEICGKGTLLRRPILPSLTQLESTGARFVHGPPDALFPIRTPGGMTSGIYRLDASATSQVASGLLMSLPLCQGDSRLILEHAASRPYIDMTLAVLRRFGITVIESEPEIFTIPGSQRFHGTAADIEADWSAAAFPLVLGAVRHSGPPVVIRGLNWNSPQGDRRIADILEQAGAHVHRLPNGIAVRRGGLTALDVSLKDAPDLLPPLTVLALFCPGRSRLRDIGRTRQKECDRPAALVSEFSRLGGKLELEGDDLVIQGSEGGAALREGAVSSHGDHRIAMALAIASAAAGHSIHIDGADAAVRKSFPDFFQMLGRLL